MAKTFGMFTNATDKTLGLDAEGNVVEGEANPAMVTLLAAPGGRIPGDLVEKHDLRGRLGDGGSGDDGGEERFRRQDEEIRRLRSELEVARKPGPPAPDEGEIAIG